MTLPNFLVIGKAKSGTTALHATLSQHPQIYMSPIKEPRFFVCDGGVPTFQGPGKFGGLTTLTEYEALFAQATEEKAIGEASPQYLYASLAERAAHAIRHYIPHARLIAILRHPADYAYSEFSFRRMLGIEPARTLAQALAEERHGLRAQWSPDAHYGANGMNYPQLVAYYENFLDPGQKFNSSKKVVFSHHPQIRIFLYEEWNQQPQRLLSDLCAFLEVDEVMLPAAIPRKNVSKGQRSVRLHEAMTQPHWMRQVVKHVLPLQWRLQLYRYLRRRNHALLPRLDPQFRHEITATVREDILRTQDMIDRDLSHWLV